MSLTPLSLPFADNANIGPPLIFNPRAWFKLTAYLAAVEARGTEISGFGFVRMVNNVLLVVNPDDVFITAQEVTPGSADVEGNNFALAVDYAAREGRAPDLRLQWHKHPSGISKHSCTDLRTIRSYGDYGMSWFLSLVVADGRPCAHLDVYQPFHIGCEVPVFMYDGHDPDMLGIVEREVAELVTVKPIQTPKNRRRRSNSRVVTAKP